MPEGKELIKYWKGGEVRSILKPNKSQRKVGSALTYKKRNQTKPRQKELCPKTDEEGERGKGDFERV